MHRRKIESVVQYKTDRWGRGNKKGGLFSKSNSVAKFDEASATEPTSAGSSVLDFGLPTWEKPQDAVSTDKYDRLPSPTKSLTKSPTRVSGAMKHIKQAKLDSPSQRLKPAPTLAAQPEHDLYREESQDELTDMWVTCNASFESIGDDITFVSMYDEPKRFHSPRRRVESQEARPSRNSPGKSNNMKIPPSIPEPPSLPVAPSSPRGAPRKTFIWKKGPNGRYVKVPVDGDVVPGTAQPQRQTQRQPPKPPEIHNNQSDEEIQRMEEEMLNKALELSKQEEQASVLAAPPQLRHASAHNTYRELPNSSSHSVSNHNQSSNVQTQLDGQEEALVRLAIERSILDVSSHASVSGGDQLPASSTHTRPNGSVDTTSLYTQARLMWPEEERGHSHVLYLGGNKAERPDTRVGFLHQPAASSVASPRRQAPKGFVWKKGPNNRYIKVPIEMDKLDEDREVEEFTPAEFAQAEEPSNRGVQSRDSGNLSRMEEAMLEEAMKRSMRDLYSGM